MGFLLLGQGVLLLAAVMLLPSLITVVTDVSRPWLTRRLGTPGRLASDNLTRNRTRTLLTAGALVAGMLMVVTTSGFMAAGFKGAFDRLGGLVKEDAFISGDVEALVESGDLTFENFFQFISQEGSDALFNIPAAVEALQPLADEGLIHIERNRFVAIPAHLSALPGAPGNFVDLDIFLQAGSFDFFEGEVEQALSLAEEGPVMLLQPMTAERLGVHVGDQLPVQTREGEVNFTVAGTGGSGWNMSIFNYVDAERYFKVTAPSHIGVVVTGNREPAEVLGQVEAIIDTIPDVALQPLTNPFDALNGVIDRLTLLLDGLLFMAIIVAALGVINTMVINVAERQREIGLLRAVGATARQVRQTIVAEAAVLGLFSAILAAVLGLLLLLVYGVMVPGITQGLGVGGNWQTIRTMLGAGIPQWALASAASLLFGPVVAGLAAYYPARQAAGMSVVAATRSERITLRRTG